MPRVWFICLLLMTWRVAARADDAAAPVGDPALDPPTLRCLGVRWVVAGDDNANASVGVEYRKRGEADWKAGLPLFRVEKGKHLAEKYGSKLDVPKGATLFAGSVVLLEPDSEYEVKLTLKDPDGDSA